MTDDRAHARWTDPDTSHEAARAITPDLRLLQQRVLDFAQTCGSGGFTDAEMEARLDDAGSTFRTRRSELTDRNMVLDSGQRRTFGGSPRRRIVWVHRYFVPGAPPVCEPPHVMTKAEKEDGLKHAGGLERSAAQMDNEGRTAFASSLREAAAFIRSCAR